MLSVPRNRVVACASVLALCLGAGVWFLLGPEKAAPEETLTRCIAAGARGDVRDFLGCFDGELLGGLRQAAAENQAEFAEGLRSRYGELAGYAISSCDGLGDDASGTVAYDVEFVYEGRSVVQRFELLERFRGWRITASGAAVAGAMPVPYGTPYDIPDKPPPHAQPILD